MKIEELKCNYQINPLGIVLENVTFTWVCTGAAGEKTEKARLVIAKDIDFEEVVFESEERVFSPCTPAASFAPGITYYWKVSVTDNKGDFAVSKVQSFEGGHPCAEFSGAWIKPAFSRELHPLMRKTFILTERDMESISRARIYICGLGLYEASLNGEKIGDDYLTPYFTDYRYWIEYQTYDITKYLKIGENRLDVILGNGWYKGRFGYLAQGQMREYYGSEFLLIADMILSGKNYEKKICTDSSWICMRSPIVLSGIYDGEVWDGRREADLGEPDARNVSMAVLADVPQGKLSPMLGVHVKAHEKLKFQELIKTPAGEAVLDFGQEITGWVEFTCSAEKSTRIVLEYGEVLQNGNFYRENLRTADAKYTFISSGKKRRARAHFTFFGFRYVKVTGLSDEEIKAGDFEATAIYSDLAETGFIQTSHKKLNRLIENTKWSQKDNFVDIPTDCPQRDERCGWTGDAQIFSGAASFHMETSSFFRKYMLDMLYEQKEKGGAVPYVVPDILTLGRLKMAEPEFDFTQDLWGEAGASVWGDAAVIIPWNMYLHFGNKSWLGEQYDNMKRWTDFIIQMDKKNCGGKHLWNCGFHFGDWLSLDVEGDAAGMDNRDGGTDKYYVASVYYKYATELTSKAAEILGLKEDKEFYADCSREVRNAIREKYVEAPGKLRINTQTAYAIAIQFHIFEEDEMDAAGENLLKILKAWDYHLATGFVGTAFLCNALTKTGHVKEAFTLLLNEDYPSWLYEVNLGATTIWERWNSLLPDGSISGTGMNSLNHYAYGAIVEWIYAAVCGISVDEENIAGRRMRIAPHTDDRLGYVNAAVEMSTGKYQSGWRLEENRVTFEFEIPFDAEAQFVPDRSYKKLRLNGEFIDENKLKEKVFTKGKYVIEGEIR